MSVRIQKVLIMSARSGRTAQRNLEAAFGQFEDLDMDPRLEPEIRNPEKIRRLMEWAHKEGAIVVHTFVETKLRDVVRECAQKLNIPEYDPLGGMIAMIEVVTGMRSLQQPGHHSLMEARVHQARNFAERHDDGEHTEGLKLADAVLLGLSRTGKTPISYMLADTGLRAANVPIVRGQNLTPDLFHASQRRVFVLTVDQERLIEVRKERSLGDHDDIRGYTDPKEVAADIEHVYDLLRHNRHWTRVDVTTRGPEEGASVISAMLRTRFPAQIPPA